MNRLCLALLVMLWFASLLPAAPLPVRVICPAIDRENGTRHFIGSYGMGFEDLREPELVVLGTVRVLARTNQERTYEVEVEKVLYGGWKEKTLQVTGGYYDDSQRRIFTLVRDRDPDAKQWNVRYAVEADEEKAMRALNEARLDFHVLSAECIFIGKEVESLDDTYRRVEVVREIAGPTPAEGERITLSMRPFQNKGFARTIITEPLVGPEKPKGDQAQAIFFVQGVDHDPQSPPSFILCTELKGPIYHAPHRQPVEREADVLAALKRRDQYPVTEGKVDDKPVRNREILFRGSIEDAIEFLGAEDTGPETLGRRRLLHDWEKARPAVLAAIEKGLPMGVEERSHDFRRLKNLIDLLGLIQKRDRKEDDLKRLIQRHLDALAQHPPELPTSRMRDPWENFRRYEESFDDVNHGLIWLLDQLPESTVQREYGPRLIRLRDQAKGQWNKEIQLALDVCHVEDRIELDTALARMKAVKPVRSQTTGIRHYGHDALAFSHDGQYLATAGGYGPLVKIWRIRDWSLVSAFPGGGKLAQFSPDDRFLYLVGGDELGDYSRYDWRTGKRDRVYKAHKSWISNMELAADGRRMLTSSATEGVIYIGDTHTGKILDKLPMKDGWDVLIVSPDGKFLIRPIRERNKNWPLQLSHPPDIEWSVESLEGPAPVIKNMKGKSQWLFSPAGRHLISAERVPSKEEGDSQVILRVYDTTRDYVEIASRRDVRFGTWLLVSETASAWRLGTPRDGHPAHSRSVETR